MKFRKKPIVVDAFQYGYDVEPDWFLEAFDNGLVRYVPSRSIKPTKDNQYPSDVLIKTLEGEMRADYYDYIIKGVNGEIYPCKADIFKKTYEKVEDENR